MKNDGIERYECEDSKGRFVLETNADLDTVEEEGREAVKKMRIAKADFKKQWVYGVVMSPYEIDSWKDMEIPEEIENAMDQYMLRLWEGKKPSLLGSEHEKVIKGRPVQVYMAPCDFWYDDSPKTPEYMVHKNAFVLVAHVSDKAEFEKAVSGEYIGFSFQGTGRRKKVEGLGPR